MPTTCFTKIQLSKQIIHLNSFTMSVFVKQIALLLLLFLLLLPVGAWKISTSPFPGSVTASLPNVPLMALDCTVWGYRTAGGRRKRPSLYPIPPFLLKSLCACPSDGTSITSIIILDPGDMGMQSFRPAAHSPKHDSTGNPSPCTHQIRFVFTSVS